MATISSVGIGSGLDVASMLSQLTKVQQQRLVPYDKQQATYNAKLTGYGTLKSALEKFDNLSKDLASSDLFNSTKTSEHSQFTAKTGSGAVPGLYKIKVTQLAQSQSLMTEGVKNQTEKLGTDGAADRTLTITTGNPAKETKIALTDDQTSLVEMRDAINKSDAGVKATIMRVGDDEYRLAITSTKTGVANQVKIQVSNDDKLGDLLNFDPAANASSAKASGMKETSKAQDAHLTINGVEVTRSENKITNAIEGVTLDLKALSKEEDGEMLSVSTDTNVPMEKIKAWVDSYNSLVDTYGRLTKFTPVEHGENPDTTNGALLGDGVLREVQSSIKNILSNVQTGSEFKGLANLGVSTDSKTGKLKIEGDKLQNALNENLEQVTNFFVGDGKVTGMATQLHSEVQRYIKTDGLIDNSTKGINDSISRLKDQVTRVNKEIDSSIERYRQQFIQLDKIMSQLSSVGNYVSQQFASASK